MSDLRDFVALADAYFDFTAASVSPFHAVSRVNDVLSANGYSLKKLDEKWEVSEGARFVVPLGDAAIIAVRRGEEPIPESGVTVLAAHTDSPTLRVKERGISWRKGYLAIPTEKYGGPILATWVDRELGIAGRVVARNGEHHLVDLPFRSVIPNLAIHLNRKANEGVKYNAHDHMVALAGVRPPDEGDLTAGERTAEGGEAESSGYDRYGDEKARGAFGEALLSAAGLSAESLWECELNLYDVQAPSRLGTRDELYTAPRIDNLVGAFTSLQAFLESSPRKTVLLALYNHEEIGSMSGEGAHSGALSRIIERLVLAEGGTAEDAMITAAKSLLVSNDVAHAMHPNYSDKYDSDYAPVLNGGPVLKLSSTVRYATTAPTGILFREACEAGGVPMQRLAMRSDMRAGSTVGPVSWARTGIPTVDVGVGLLAMHSVRETAGTDDIGMMTRALISLVDR